MFKRPLIFLLVIFQIVHSHPNVDNSLLKYFEQNESANITLTLTQGNVQNILNVINSKSYSSRAERLTNIAETLKNEAHKSQEDLVNFLLQEKSESMTTHLFWITNKIIVKGADLNLVNKLSRRDDVTEIRPEIVIPLNYKMMPVDIQPDDGEQWGVSKMRAPQVWNKGYSGEGIVVAIIDTGVLGTHEALKTNYRANYGWFDPIEQTTIPNDPSGHGTHIAGSIAGTMGIGVAPNATWIGCKGCEPYFCNEDGLLGCAQFVSCPTDPNGDNPDCGQAPHVASNSWGGTDNGLWFDDVIATWTAGGIIPVFSVGNSGPSCGSGSYPGTSSLTIGVGASDENDNVTDFSGLGPGVNVSLVKPNVVAPGKNIFSASHVNETAYTTMQGTSMACPHVTGLVALMLSKNQNLTYEQVKEAIQMGAIQIGGGGEDCGGISEDTFPNNHVGWGRVDALDSINLID